MKQKSHPGLFQFKRGLHFRWLAFLSLFSVLLFGLYGCGSSAPGTDQSDSAEGESELIISLTDAEGDFLNYTVDVVSLKMLKSNGAEIETLPLTTRLDFSQYIEVSEFLTTATVPSGHYTGAKIILDFGNAEISVEDADGNAILAGVQDENGDPINQLTVDISLNGERDFVIRPGIPAHITLDFDLDASNAVVVNGTEATVTVSPVLVADTILEDPKPHRLRGLLGRVNVDENKFSVLIRPFRHRTEKGFGKLYANVSDETHYEIDGTVYNGEDGLTQLAQLKLASAIVVYGLLNTELNQYEAMEVYAGSSVPWNKKDIVKGNVISREENVLVVRGARLMRANGNFAFNDNVRITLNENTRVVKQANAGNQFSIADISIGQKITVLGKSGSTTNNSFDADLVRIKYTNITGTVVSASPLAVNLQGIDHRNVNLFDFTGTGSDATTDADAEYYEVNAGNLSLSNIETGAPVRVRGHISSFGTAPEDFNAQTVIDTSNMPAKLVAGFAEGSLTAISDINEMGLQLDLTDAGERHHLVRAGIRTDLLSLVNMPLISPRESGKGLFVITHSLTEGNNQGHSVQVYTSYADFQLAVNTQLEGNTAVISVHAKGRYETDLNVFMANKINIRLAE